MGRDFANGIAAMVGAWVIAAIAVGAFVGFLAAAAIISTGVLDQPPSRECEAP